MNEINFETQVYSLTAASYNEWISENVCVESTNNINIRITCHRIIGDRCIWERKPLMNAWMVAVAVSHSDPLSFKSLCKWWCA